MPKVLTINPEQVRKAGQVDLGSIAVNQYRGSVQEEATALGTQRLLRVYRDMAYIREFESMLDAIKKLGAYEGIVYNHAGPAHLSIGQEGAAVGQCVHLQVHDHIFGSHRSHGEIIAKGLRSVEDLCGGMLGQVMEHYFDGMVLRVVEPGAKHNAALNVNGKVNFTSTDEEELGVDFLLYGLLAEVFGRETGFNRGMGGSMHAFFMPFGVFPNNALVGGSADIATGAALFKKTRKAPGIAIANIGDASTGCGPVWEAMGFASMAQYNSLWGDEYRGGLPIIFNFMNNFYGMGGQPIGETAGFDYLARIGAAFNPNNMHAEVVDGNNPLAVADAYKRKMETIATQGGPVLLDVQCYRQSGHSPSDQSSYRERDEIEAWKSMDPLTEFGTKLLESGLLSQGDLDTIGAHVKEKMVRVLKLAIDDSVSPRMHLSPLSGVSQMMFSDFDEEDFPGVEAGDLLDVGPGNPRIEQLAKKVRIGIDENGAPQKPSKSVTYGDAIFEAIFHHFKNDGRVIAYGEENRDWGGAFAVYRGLTEALPYHRLFNSPISEAAIVGTAVGYALEGGRPIVELMYCDFMGRAGDEVFNQLPKWQAMSGGYIKMPVVLRVSVGSKYGAQHSQDWTALTAHVPGLKVVFPATPYSAKGLMASALSGNDPVVFFESQRLYNQVEVFHPGGVPEEYYRIPLGQPTLIQEGRDLTILTFGATLYRAVDAAKRFESEFGLSVEIIDGQTLVPFDYTLLVESLQKTGKLIVASDACERGSYLHTIAGQISQIAFDTLDAPVCVIGAKNWIVPPAELEEAYFPQTHEFLDTYHTQIKPLPGYTPVSDRSARLMLELNRLGI